MRIVLFIMLVLTLLESKVSRDEQNFIVSDASTKLQWQDNTVTDAMSWSKANNYCKSLTLGGYQDWRMPNIIELKTIVRKDVKPAILDEFKNTKSEHYWSYSSYDGNKKYYWNVFFIYGVVDFSKNINENYVRCVRGGKKRLSDSQPPR